MSAQTETDRYGAFVRRVVAAYARRVGDRDIEGLAGLVALRDDLDASIGAAVEGLRAEGYSWAQIGRVTGMTRQGAQQRYSRRAG